MLLLLFKIWITPFNLIVVICKHICVTVTNHIVFETAADFRNNCSAETLLYFIMDGKRKIKNTCDRSLPNSSEKSFKSIREINHSTGDQPFRNILGSQDPLDLPIFKRHIFDGRKTLEEDWWLKFQNFFDSTNPQRSWCSSCSWVTEDCTGCFLIVCVRW